MPKILEATCSAAGVVTADNVTVPAATVLSEGKQASTGVLLLDEEIAKYLTSSATDIKTTLEKLVLVITDVNAALTQIASTLTSIGAGMNGSSTAPPGTLASDVSNINSQVSALNTIKSDLNTLKGALK